MSMSILEATVEIVKAALSGGGGASTSTTSYFLAVERNREELIQSIDKIYKKIYRLENGTEYEAK